MARGAERLSLRSLREEHFGQREQTMQSPMVGRSSMGLQQRQPDERRESVGGGRVVPREMGRCRRSMLAGVHSEVQFSVHKI